LGGVDSAKSSEKQHFLGQWEPKAIEQSFAQIVNRDMPSPEEALESMCEAAERGSFDGLLEGSTRICIAPGYTFQAVDGLITNFHQPRSTLLLLVASFLGGKKPLQELYQHAVESKYRFLSYGDACLLINGQSSPAQHVSEDALRGDGEFASVPENRQRVLLHSCCAPCSGAMVEAMVADGLDVTVLFYNPNIHPKEEYELRKEENKKFCEKINVPFVDADYNDRDFFKRARGMEFDPERGRRCTMCFDMRMDYTAAYAREHGFDTISTTNATSRWKSQEQVDASGFRSAAKVDGVTYWGGEQWKNEEMTERKYRINADNAFYKQEYCGCAYSLRDVNEYRKEQLGLPPVRPGQGGFYSDPAIDAEEESQEVVDAFFADTLSEKKEESRRLKEIYRERKRSERAGADGNNW
jgi:predicted adenine nucleotide alpha hydrolase (AANH) superfamily ATPase